MTFATGSRTDRARGVLGVLAGALLAAIGALLLGEQPLEGVTVLVAGGLFGLAVGETILSVARGGDGYLAAAAALLTEAGLVWALDIETGHELRAAPAEAWVAVAASGALAAWWVRSAARRGRRTSAPT